MGSVAGVTVPFAPGGRSEDLEVALAAARRGGEVVREAFGRPVRADFKGDVNPVTAADREAEEAILAVLRQARPDDGVLAEEGGTGDPTSERIWIVDPLDGTVNFVHGLPQVAVSVALWEGGALWWGWCWTRSGRRCSPPSPVGAPPSTERASR
jgi:fructose-1,6-bisphosphatase/inositol monophosphatase family enzyme